MAALTQLLAQRRQAAIDRAERVASGFPDHRSAGMEQQLELETALDDADRYERMLTSVGGAVVRREAGPYFEGGPDSFFRDLTEAARYPGNAQLAAVERLQRSAALTADVSRMTESRDIGIAAMAGTIPPRYLLEYAATAARAASPLFDALDKIPLGGEGTQVVIGRIAGTGASAGFVGEGAGPESPDVTSTALTLDVKLVTGLVTETWTFFNRAGPTSDLVIAKDLGEAVGTAAEVGIINGPGGPNSPIGMLNTTGVTTTTFTSGAPTVATLIQKICACATTAALARKQRPNVCVMHSRRWLWICSQSDTSLQPVVGLSTTPPDPTSPYVGVIGGMGVVISDNMPINLGAGADQDAVILVRKQDMFLAVDDAHMAISVILAQPMVNLWAGEYLIFSAARYPSGVGVLTGTGLNAVAT